MESKKKNGTFCDAKQLGFALTDHRTKRLRLSMLICMLEVKEILHKDCEGWVVKKNRGFLVLITTGLSRFSPGPRCEQKSSNGQL